MVFYILAMSFWNDDPESSIYKTTMWGLQVIMPLNFVIGSILFDTDLSVEPAVAGCLLFEKVIAVLIFLRLACDFNLVAQYLSLIALHVSVSYLVINNEVSRKTIATSVILFLQLAVVAYYF